MGRARNDIAEAGRYLLRSYGDKEMKAPTAAQKRRFAAIVKIGCMACLQHGYVTTPEIHHTRKYGRRNHDNTIGLCPPHHRPIYADVVSRHGSPDEFEKTFGTDEELLEKCNELLGDRKCQI